MSNQVGCMILTPHIHCGLTLMKHMLFLFSYILIIYSDEVGVVGMGDDDDDDDEGPLFFQ
jgi:hypothetical protein